MFSALAPNGSYLPEELLSGRAAGRELAGLQAWEG